MSRTTALLLIATAVVAGVAVALLTDGPGGPAPLPDPVSYVALGDSLATGAGATTSYVEEYGRHIERETGRTVHVDNRGVNGWTSEDLLSALQGDETLRAAVGDAHVLTVDIGGNDLLRARMAYDAGDCGGEDGQACIRAAVAAVRERWPAILDEVIALAQDAVRLRTMDLYYPFVAEDRRRGVYDDFRVYLAEVNAVVRQSAAARGVPVARVHEAFNGPDGARDPIEAGLIARDGVHPSAAGHRVIAERLAELGYDAVPDVPEPQALRLRLRNFARR